MRNTLLVSVVLFVTASLSLAADNVVPETRMRAVFEELKTPFKVGVVICGENGKAVDCPSIFRQANRWYMMYICMNDVGYETYLAVSDDLVAWTTLGKILPFRPDAWDQWQAAGGVALCDTDWNGTHQLEMVDGKYRLSYDLVNWTKWEGPHLIEPSESWDETFAHKPWLVKHEGVVYHFYCAVGSAGRVIALATSRDLRTEKKDK